MPLKHVVVCDISLYAVVKQRLKGITGKVLNRFNSVFTMVLSIEERVDLVEYVFREGNRYTDFVQE